MKITPEDIKKFQEIYQEVFQKEISESKALDCIISLSEILKIIIRKKKEKYLKNTPNPISKKEAPHK